MIWVLKGGGYYCSTCNGKVVQASRFNYCPFCGESSNNYENISETLLITPKDIEFPVSDPYYSRRLQKEIDEYTNTNKIPYDKYEPGGVIHDHMIFEIGGKENEKTCSGN